MIYSDLNQQHPTSSALEQDLAAVYQSITNILATPKGSRFFNPEFGSDLGEILFEPMDDDTVMIFENSVTEAIRRWDPRVSILFDKTGVVQDPDSNVLSVRVAFKVAGMGDEVFDYRAIVSDV